DKAAEALRVNHRPHQPAERPEAPGDEPRQESPRGHHESGPLGDLGELLSGVLGGDPQADLPAAPQAPGCEPRFADWCERITGWFTPPKPGELVPSLPGASETVPPALGGAEPPTLLPLPVHDVAAGQSATPAAWPVDGDVVQRIDHALRSHEQTAHHHNFPGKHTPLGAPGQPAVMAPGSGSALAGHADGSHMAITAAAAAAAAGGATLALRRSIPGSSRIGGQPGVTPD
ncbi:MAG: hypothetical protein ACRDQB_09355, partial [Thermocrispum sp.]